MSVLLPAASPADVLHLRNGGRVEGEVTEEGDVYRVATVGGAVGVKKDEVESVERRETAQQAYAAKRAEVDALSAKNAAPPDLGAAERRLGLWCAERGLRKQAAEHLAAADRRLGGDAECAKALTALGCVRWDDRWLPKSEAMARLGYVLKDGRWVRQEEAAASARQQEDEKRVREHLRAIGGGDAGRRKKAEAALEAIPADHKLRPLMDALDDSSTAARAYAAGHVGALRDYRAVTPLASLALRERNDDVRRAAVASLQTLLGRSAIQIFVRALDFQNAARRMNAERALAELEDPRAIGPALQRYMSLIGNVGGAREIGMGLEGKYVAEMDARTGAFAGGLEPVVLPYQSGVSVGIGAAPADDAALVEKERLVLVAVLEKLSGKKFGDNAMAWIEWWKREKAGK